MRKDDAIRNKRYQALYWHLLVALQGNRGKSRTIGERTYWLPEKGLKSIIEVMRWRHCQPYAGFDRMVLQAIRDMKPTSAYDYAENVTYNLDDLIAGVQLLWEERRDAQASATASQSCR